MALLTTPALPPPPDVAPLFVVEAAVEVVEPVERVESVEVVVEEEDEVVLMTSLVLSMHFWKRHPHARAAAMYTIICENI